jgi:RNA polymerase sigma factor (sigma-70 family)
MGYELTGLDRKLLRRQLRREGVRRDDVEDVVQEVALAAYRCGSVICNPMSYLRKATDRLLAARRRQRQLLVTVPMTDVDEPQDEGGIASSYARLEAESTLRPLLRELPPSRQQALLDRYSGLSWAEIATRLGVKPGTVRTWHYRDLPALRIAAGVRELRGAVTDYRLSEPRLRRISEIAGVSLELTRHLLLETEYSKWDQHGDRLSTASDEVLAAHVREWAAKALPADSLAPNAHTETPDDLAIPEYASVIGRLVEDPADGWTPDDGPPDDDSDRRSAEAGAIEWPEGLGE